MSSREWASIVVGLVLGVLAALVGGPYTVPGVMAIAAIAALAVWRLLRVQRDEEDLAADLAFLPHRPLSTGQRLAIAAGVVIAGACLVYLLDQLLS